MEDINNQVEYTFVWIPVGLGTTVNPGTHSWYMMAEIDIKWSQVQEFSYQILFW